VSPVINREDIRAVSDYGSTNGQVFGAASNYNEIRTIPIGNGRWFNEGDNNERRRVAIVGWELLKNVFPGRPAVGATLLLNGIRFDVIGVLAKVGQEGNNGTNGRIFVLVETMRNLFPLKEKNTENAISFINYRPLNKAEHLRSKEEVHQIIARLHGFNPKLDDVFEDWDTVENSQKVGKIFDAMDYFLGGDGDRIAGSCRYRCRSLSVAASGSAGTGRGFKAGVAVIRDLGIQAYSELRDNKRRSILTMLGMAWGMATVVLLLAYGAGFESGLWIAFRSFGTNLIFLFPGRTSLQAGGTKAGNEVKLSVKDLDYVRAEVPLLKRLSPEVFKQCNVAYGTRGSTYGVSGVYANYPKMRRMDFEEGTPFSEAEDFTHTRVAFIGADVKK